jgi:hypothetical protein
MTRILMLEVARRSAGLVGLHSCALHIFHRPSPPLLLVSNFRLSISERIHGRMEWSRIDSDQWLGLVIAWYTFVDVH